MCLLASLACFSFFAFLASLELVVSPVFLASLAFLAASLALVRSLDDVRTCGLDVDVGVNADAGVSVGVDLGGNFEGDGSWGLVVVFDLWHWARMWLSIGAFGPVGSQQIRSRLLVGWKGNRTGCG